MSAFVVADSLINGLVSSLYHGDDMYIFKRLGYDLHANTEECKRLSIDLHLLNRQAVDERYSDKPSKKFHPDDFVFSHVLPGNDLQNHQRLGCLIYQCSEGSVPEHDLYKALENWQSAIANRIIRGLPGYDGFVWGE